MTGVARKTLMALTGLFLCMFLIVHMLGNLQLFLPEPEARIRFNQYAATLAGLPPIKVAAWLTYFCVIAHSLLALSLGIRNRRSAGEGYSDRSPVAGAPWYSRYMELLGVVILVFLAVHLRDFWFPFKFGGDLAVDPAGRADLFALVKVEFGKGWKVLLYVLGVVAVGFHLLHGIYSGLRSLGLSHPTYAKWSKYLGYGFAVVLTAGFAAMPVFLYLRS